MVINGRLPLATVMKTYIYQCREVNKQQQEWTPLSYSPLSLLPLSDPFKPDMFIFTVLSVDPTASPELPAPSHGVSHDGPEFQRVDIELLTGEAHNARVVAPVVLGYDLSRGNTYIWDVPQSVIPEGDYFIRIKGVGTDYESYSHNFPLVSIPTTPLPLVPLPPTGTATTTDTLVPTALVPPSLPSPLLRRAQLPLLPKPAPALLLQFKAQSLLLLPLLPLLSPSWCSKSHELMNYEVLNYFENKNILLNHYWIENFFN